jgi:hypothetical protein
MILSAITFCKRASCPSSETLLAYRTCGLAAELMVGVASHLDECDFCGAEFQLLAEHAPPEQEEFAAADMPRNLRWLAESLLGAHPLRLESLAEIAGYEKERLTLTDA